MKTQSGIDLGIVYISIQAEVSVHHEEDIWPALDRHEQGDWGEVNPEQRQHNERAAQDGGTLHSIYGSEYGLTFDILTFTCNCNQWPEKVEGATRRTLVCMPYERFPLKCKCVWQGVPPNLLPHKRHLFPEDVLQAVDRLLNHVWEHELEPYRGCTKSEQAEHIIRSVAVVQGWLHGIPNPTALLDKV